MKKNKWLIIIATMIFVAVIVGGGIYYWQAQNFTEIVQADSANVYEWKTQGATFSYPNGYKVLERSDGSLLITTATELPDGDVSTFATLLEIDVNTSLEERLAQYSTEEIFSQETKMIGDHEFTKVSLYANFGGYNYTRYLLEFNGKLLDYKVGKNDEDLAAEVLESIQF